MSGNYGKKNWSGGGGGSKQKSFAADPLKGFLMARSVALSYAKDLCVAGKIELGQVPDYTDRMTVLQYGQISVDAKVDKEVMRIAARVQARAKALAELAESRTYGDPDDVQGVGICNDCAYGPHGTGECPDVTDGMRECPEFEEVQPIDAVDQEEHAANERLREQQEQEQQAAEDEASGQDTVSDGPGGQGTNTYNCGSCGKVYKTMRGLEQHNKKGCPGGKS